MWSVCLESSVACADCLHSPSPPGVSKTVTVDVKGSGPLWLKLRDLADGITYNFRIRAKTFIYGPEVEANITTGPGEGSGRDVCLWTFDRVFVLNALRQRLIILPQELQDPPESPLSHATVQPWPSTGPVGTRGVLPSPATWSRPDLQVRASAA